jgi:hypothetical protein
MKLDPVYLVEPRPAPKVASRRGFLALASSFAAGAMIGGACGYSIGRAGPPGGASAAPAADSDPPSSGDVELDELRWLATKAPIEKLVEKNIQFFTRLDRTYRTDPVLWRGVERLCRVTLADEKNPYRRIIALQAVVAIEKDGPPAELRLEEYLPQLKAAGRR